MQHGSRHDASRRGPSRPRGRQLPIALAVTLTLFGGVFLGQVFAASSALPGLSALDINTPEGGPEESDHFVTVPVLLSAASADGVSVNWRTVDGTATAPKSARQIRAATTRPPRGH